MTLSMRKIATLPHICIKDSLSSPSCGWSASKSLKKYTQFEFPSHHNHMSVMPKVISLNKHFCPRHCILDCTLFPSSEVKTIIRKLTLTIPIPDSSVISCLSHCLFNSTHGTFCMMSGNITLFEELQLGKSLFNSFDNERVVCNPSSSEGLS